ncbi:MAG: universal stress protein, partial [Gillisia sp.]
MKRILVPTDFSEQAENAIRVAAQLANRYDGEIFLLHMLELPMNLVGTAASGSGVAGSSSQSLPEALFFMKLAKKRFDELLAAPYLEGIKVHETVD